MRRFERLAASLGLALRLPVAVSGGTLPASVASSSEKSSEVPTGSFTPTVTGGRAEALIKQSNNSLFKAGGYVSAELDLNLPSSFLPNKLCRARASTECGQNAIERD